MAAIIAFEKNILNEILDLLFMYSLYCNLIK